MGEGKNKFQFQTLKVMIFSDYCQAFPLPDPHVCTCTHTQTHTEPHIYLNLYQPIPYIHTPEH